MAAFCETMKARNPESSAEKVFNMGLYKEYME